VRSGIRGLFAVCDADLEGELRGLLCRDDDYATAGKPVCDYEDRAAREALIDALAKDAGALLLALDGKVLGAALSEAAALLATLVGQDLDEGADGVFRIARRVAAGRVISTVDPEARHGRKTSANGFDGYKGHVAVDPDSELIVSTAVGAAGAGDASAAGELLAEEPGVAVEQPLPAEPAAGASAAEQPAEPAPPARGEDERAEPGPEPLAVYGDAAYGAGALLATLELADIEVNCKVQPPVAPGGRYSKDAFGIDLEAATVSCPAGQVATLRPQADGQRIARFGAACGECPLAERCTTSENGRTIGVGPHEAQLARARSRQADPDWKADYTATRPKVERKIAHLMRRRHGGRRARVRGRPKVAADFALLAAAANLRLGVLGLSHRDGTWAASAA